MAKKTIKVLRFMTNLLFILFVIMFTYVFVIIYRGGVPKFFGYSVLRVISVSMEPEISQGDLIYVKEVSEDDIEVSDIITFYSRDPYIDGFLNTHRVVDIIDKGEKSGGREYVTKGDGNIAEDYYAAWQKDVIGKYQGKIPGGRALVYLINALRNRVVYFMVMVFPILICFVHSIYAVMKILFYQEETDDEYEEDNRK